MTLNSSIVDDTSVNGAYHEVPPGEKTPPPELLPIYFRDTDGLRSFFGTENYHLPSSPLPKHLTGNSEDSKTFTSVYDYDPQGTIYDAEMERFRKLARATKDLATIDRVLREREERAQAALQRKDADSAADPDEDEGQKKGRGRRKTIRQRLKSMWLSN